MKEDLEKFTAEKDKEVADVRKRHKLVLAETQKQLAVVRENENADVLEVKSNAELVVAKLHPQRDVRLSQIRSSGAAEADKIKVKTDTYVQTKRANAEAEVAKNNAQSLRLQSSAEKFAAVPLRAKRKYEAKMRSLQSMRGLYYFLSLSLFSPGEQTRCFFYFRIIVQSIFGDHRKFQRQPYGSIVGESKGRSYFGYKWEYGRTLDPTRDPTMEPTSPTVEPTKGPLDRLR